MTSSVARVVSVIREPSGSSLVADALAGNLVLLVDNAADFNEEGGTLALMDGSTLAYSTVDQAADSITLSAPLPADVWAQGSVEGDNDYFIAVFPESTDLKAVAVFDDDNDEGIQAIIPLELQGYFEEGIRDTGQEEAVVVDDASGQWRVTQIADQKLLDGSTIDPSSLPPSPPAGTDGNAPAVSPPLLARGGLGIISLSWMPIANADPVTYDVYGKAGDGVTIDPSVDTPLTSTMGTSFTVRSVDGVDIAPGDVYTFVLRARDDDGAAAPSAPVTAAGVAITGADIAVDYAYVGTLQPGQILGGTLENDYVLSGKIATATGGARVEQDAAGIRVFKPDGGYRFNVPTSASEDATLTGHADLESLTTHGVDVQGTDNQISGLLKLPPGIVDPQTKPALSVRIDGGSTLQLTLPDGESLVDWASWDATYWLILTARTGGAATVWKVHKTTGAWTVFNPAYVAVKPSATTVIGLSVSPASPGGANVAWLLYQSAVNTNGNTTRTYSCQVYSLAATGAASLRLDLGAMWTNYSASSTPPKPAIYTNGTSVLLNVYIASYTGTDGAYIRLTTWTYGPDQAGDYGWAAVSQKSLPIDPGIPVANVKIHGLYFDVADYGELRAVVSYSESGQTNSATEGWDNYTVTSSTIATKNPSANVYDPSLWLLAWDGSRFWNLSSSARAIQLSQTTVDTSRAVTYTWYDSDATGGTHETKASPSSSLTQYARCYIQVTTPSPADHGGTNDPDSIRVYVSNHLQGSAVGSTYLLNAYNASGAASPGSNGFASVASPGMIDSTQTDPLVKIHGDGTWRLGGLRGNGTDLLGTGLAGGALDRLRYVQNLMQTVTVDTGKVHGDYSNCSLSFASIDAPNGLGYLLGAYGVSGSQVAFGLTINMPSNGAVITGVHGTGNVTVAGGVIPGFGFAAGKAQILWLDLGLDGGTPTFYVSGAGTDNWTPPPTWVPVFSLVPYRGWRWVGGPVESGWQAPAYGTNIIAYDGLGVGYVDPGFQIIGSRVNVRGMIKATAAVASGSVLLQFLPLSDDGLTHVFSCLSSSNTASIRVDLNSAGNLVNQVALASGAWVSLDGISYSI